MALKSQCKTLQKVAPNEDIFVLRAQDVMAPKIVMLWISENLHCSDDKLREAFECALRMRKFANTKSAT